MGLLRVPTVAILLTPWVALAELLSGLPLMCSSTHEMEVITLSLQVARMREVMDMKC